MPLQDQKRILLADADAFFVSVARLVDPEGAGRAKLLIVGGSADGRGVVTSASYEARAFGVRSAMPTGRALKLCPDATVVGVPRKECVERSKAVRKILDNFSPSVEQASIDEFYIDLSGTEGLYGSDTAGTASTIRTTILDETQLPFSIGCGTSKLIAKLAAQRAKPHLGDNGVHIVPAGGEISFMKEHQLRDIPLIGPKFGERLEKMGLRSVPQALNLEVDALIALMGERTGRWLYRRVRGLDASRVHPRRPNKSMSHEETFRKDISSDAQLEKELLILSTRVAGDLRKKKLKAKTVSVKIRYHDFKTRQANHTVKAPISADRPIHEAALALFRRLRKTRGSPVRLLGVALSQLNPASGEWQQLGLFEASEEGMETDHDIILSKAVDNIREKFGRKGILRGAEVKNRGV
jgi:DNA polymerase-4